MSDMSKPLAMGLEMNMKRARELEAETASLRTRLSAAEGERDAALRHVERLQAREGEWAAVGVNDMLRAGEQTDAERARADAAEARAAELTTELESHATQELSWKTLLDERNRAVAAAEARAAKLEELRALHRQDIDRLADSNAHLLDEAASLRRSLEALEARTVTVADEAFGPFPVQSAEEALTAIERGVFESRQEYEALRRSLEEARRVLDDIEAYEIDWAKGADENMAAVQNMACVALNKPIPLANPSPEGKP